ncbi:hypothetical protein FJ937_11855 [Mesorhizobium sp. B2-4-4]|uniref:hypothetical protein n=1 Tax=Mesorhizobium sp. B2-4-4 TaxID=2589945 RepID=UPI00112C1D85|nr:hypothetical protein [Mesorhizobium sp. B2-4-4]TPL52050.1 hypothetical protein FJ937_11855 [Mesorhizobium sp. B2-4-4]
MNLNPALAKIVADAHAKYEANNEQARELLLNLIGNTLERIHATPSGELVDYPQETTDLLEMVEQWCVGQHEDGYLIFRDPADDVVTLES